MDRAGLVSELQPEEPGRPPQQGWRRLIAPVLVGGAVLLKVAGTLKFLGIFISVGAYALIWGWRFAVGFVLLILVHELGHYVEARRQGLSPQLPVFIPFLGAYVALRGQPFDPWRNALVSVAGPVAGGIAALACLVYGNAVDSDLLRGSRLCRLLPQPRQPAPDRDPRRWPHPAIVACPPGGWRAREPRRGAGAWPVSSAPTPSRSRPCSRSAWWPRTSLRIACE